MPSPTRCRVLHFAIVAALLASAGCGPYDVTPVWVCLNPVTGKDDVTVYDASHYVNGTFDPCHCYDPCGPEKSCPIVVDAGPPTSGCDAGASSDAGG
jgi:hypothetical protein